MSRTRNALMIGTVVALLALAACPKTSTPPDSEGQALAAPPPATGNAAPTNVSPTDGMMELTVRIDGPGAVPNSVSFGTGFILTKRDSPQSQVGHLVLVTAAHVLTEISGPEARVHLRQKVSDAEWKELPVSLSIRDGGQPKWTQHPTEDVAAEYIAVPQTASLRRYVAWVDEVLATDDTVNQIALHPGDNIFALGYPYGVGWNFDFPILRTGAVATYPLTPLGTRKKFGFDFSVFAGNSGGPVFFYNATGARMVGQALNLGGGGTFTILGLVLAEATAPPGVQIPPGASQDLGLAVVANSAMIRETIDRLPPPAP